MASTDEPTTPAEGTDSAVPATPARARKRAVPKATAAKPAARAVAHLGGQLVALGGRALGVLQAPRQAGRHQVEPDLLQGLGGRRELGHDVAAVTLVGQHLLQPAHLALDPAQALVQVGDGLLGKLHQPSVPGTRRGMGFSGIGGGGPTVGTPK